MKITSMDRDEARDDDITDVASMAQIDLANEAEHLNNASTVVGSEVRSAPGGDKAVSVNEQSKCHPKEFMNAFLPHCRSENILYQELVDYKAESSSEDE